MRWSLPEPGLSACRRIPQHRVNAGHQALQRHVEVCSHSRPLAGFYRPGRGLQPDRWQRPVLPGHCGSDVLTFEFGQALRHLRLDQFVPITLLARVRKHQMARPGVDNTLEQLHARLIAEVPMPAQNALLQ